MIVPSSSLSKLSEVLGGFRTNPHGEDASHKDARAKEVTIMPVPTVMVNGRQSPRPLLRRKTMLDPPTSVRRSVMAQMSLPTFPDRLEIPDFVIPSRNSTTSRYSTAKPTPRLSTTSQISNRTSRTSRYSRSSRASRIAPPPKIRRFSRLALWLSFLVLANLKLWTGKTRVPVTCNLIHYGCPVWPVGGNVREGYESVADAFQQNFDDGMEVGAGFAAYAKYWPEFAQGNKQDVTLKDLLGHRAGVTYLNKGPTLDDIGDLDRLAKILEAQPHNFDGRGVQGYAGITRGWYLNELIRRAHPKRRTIGQILRHEIMPLLDDVEFYVGLPLHLEHRISHLIAPPALPSLIKIFTPNLLQKNPPSPAVRAVINPMSITHKALRASAPQVMAPWPMSHNRREMWANEGPSFSGMSNARSLAKMAALLANRGELGGVRIFSEETAQRAFQPLDEQMDVVVRRNLTFTVGGWGYRVKFPACPEIEWIGWGGVGGSLVYWNPDLKISFSYVPNSMGLATMGDHRSSRVLGAFMKSFKALQNVSSN
ncbi:hypothetical protein HDU97_001844 [Phlyctochytrium planicorne]|nr:hypothetical protein HDU97_001844 [Phlyctochytrium planicorne]